MLSGLSQGSSCQACGSVNRAGRKFCAECGAPLALLCSACGAANEPGERFCGECGTTLEAVSPRAEAPAAVERKLVSVLFADLVGFTPLAEGRDAEEVRELLSRYFETARRLIERYGGTVEKFIGDAVMAVWGTPTAQEDDAERAVRAALDLVVAVTALGDELQVPELAARAAVVTGEAAVTLGAEGQGMVAGDLVNTASRVQTAAEPHTVLVGETTRRATEAAIAYADAGVHELKGRTEPIPLWRALRVTAGRAGGLKSERPEPPFVGRERELRILKELFHASAEERRAHLVSIVGIAGIGKSRLAWELYKYLDGLAGATIRWHRGRCLAYGEGVTYWALAEMVRMRAGIAEGEEPNAARAKLHAALEQSVEDADERAWVEPRLAQLLALESGEGFDQADLFAGWRLFLERIAERDPVVLVFEDMQWADAPLLEFVEYLLDWSRNHAVLVLALARPELAQRHPQWASNLRNATMLALEPLPKEAMEMLIDGFVPGLPEDLRSQILDRAEGVPLYAVETVRMLLDRGLLEQQGDDYRPTGEIVALEIPETLQALAAARLDGLAPEERRLLQDASVLGKSFTARGLAAVSGTAGPELDSVLSSLVRKEIFSLQVDPRSPERGQYMFLQDLLRQIAYETLSRQERKRRHLAVADHLEQEWLASDQQDVVEIVASHYVSALELDPSADDAEPIRAKAEAMLVRAGDHAASLAASDSAQRYFEQALELAESPLQQAELHERAGQMAMLGARTKSARAHFEQAIAILEELGLAHPAARVTAQLGVLTWQQEADVQRAIADMDRSLAVLVGEEPDADLATLAVQLARLLYFNGRGDEAMERNELALEIAERLRLPAVLSHGLNTKSLILDTRGRHEEAEVLLRRSLELALAHDLSDAALRAYNNLVATVHNRDLAREALELSRTGLELARRVGNRDSEWSFNAWMAACLYELGEWDEALAADEAALADQGVAALWRLTLVPLFLHRGEREEARRRIDGVRETVDSHEVQARAHFRSTEAHLLVVEGSPDEALAAAEDALAARVELGIWHPGVRDALEAALDAAVALGDEAKLDELLALVEGLAPGDLSPWLRATGARFGALRAARHDDHVTAGAGFAAAARLLREIERPFELAVVLLEHAEWIVSQDHREEAEPLLADAGEIFERLRATPWIERLERLSPALPVPTPG